jgi:hypothetical protein
VVVLVQVILFVGFHSDRWHKSLLPLGRPAASAGEGLIIRCDGHAYYAWLRSLLLDGDWSFDNEFDDHNVVGDAVPPPLPRTLRGRRPNQCSVGPACLWALTVVPGHLALKALQGCGLSWAADGYSLPYQLLVGCTTLLISFMGLVFLFGACRRFAEPPRASLAAAFLTLGTTIIFYSAIEVSMAHSVGPAVVAGLMWYWLRTYGSDRPRRWFLVGVLVGLAALMRWQLVTFAFLPAGESLLAIFRAEVRSRAGPEGRSRGMFRPAALLALAAFGAVVTFIPQVIAWRCVYGQWLVTPIAVAHNWLNPSWWRVLVDQERGLFTWTPLTLLASLGFLAWRRRTGSSIARAAAWQDGAKPSEALALLFGAFALQVYVLASLWGEAVQLGVSYGLRHFTESVVVLGPGLALLLETATRKWRPVLYGLGCLLVLWNLLLICQYRYGCIPAAGGAEFGTLLKNVPRLVLRKRALLVGQVLVGPALLAGLSWSFERSRVGDSHRRCLNANRRATCLTQGQLESEDLPISKGGHCAVSEGAKGQGDRRMLEVMRDQTGPLGIEHLEPVREAAYEGKAAVE